LQERSGVFVAETGNSKRDVMKALSMVVSGGVATIRRSFAFTPVDLVFLPCCVATELLYGIHEFGHDWDESPVLYLLDELTLKPERPTAGHVEQTIGDRGAALPKLRSKLYREADETRILKTSRLDRAIENLAGEVVKPFLGSALVASLGGRSRLAHSEGTSYESVAGMPELLWESLEIMTIRCREDRGLRTRMDGRVRLPQECIQAALDRRVEQVVRSEDRLVVDTRLFEREELRLEIVFRCPGDKVPRQGVGTNVALGGVFVETTEPGALREKIELEIQMGGRKYKVSALVITNTLKGMGLRFLVGQDLVEFRSALKEHTLRLLSGTSR